MMGILSTHIDSLLFPDLSSDVGPGIQANDSKHGGKATQAAAVSYSL